MLKNKYSDAYINAIKELNKKNKKDNEERNQLYNKRRKLIADFENKYPAYKYARSFSHLDKLRVYILLSYFFTIPCIIFMFIAPTDTIGPMILFGSITATLHFNKRMIKNKILEHDIELKKHQKKLFQIDDKIKRVGR